MARNIFMRRKAYLSDEFEDPFAGPRADDHGARSQFNESFTDLVCATKCRLILVIAEC
jgi:hypothetical protein